MSMHLTVIKHLDKNNIRNHYKVLQPMNLKFLA